MEEHDEEFEAQYQEVIANDLKNISHAMDRMIDSVSRFKSVESIDELEPEEWEAMLTSLDFTKFIISGVMYTHGIPLCSHDHDEEEDVD